MTSTYVRMREIADAASDLVAALDPLNWLMLIPFVVLGLITGWVLLEKMKYHKP